MVKMKNPADTRKPYSGLSRSLVIAIDVGTTFSGVSYAILEPGEIPKIHGVTRFPGQEHEAGNSKIPSIIYYDKHGSIMAAGAEADSNSIVAQAEDEGWIKVELFKLRLRPRTMQLNMNGMRLTPLPKRKTPVHVFGDYLAYLYRCTRSFITETHANGTALWNAVESDIQFVLSHPNGWEGPQQTRMRNAAVYGSLVPDTDAGKARIRFVTEGEASLHACVLSGLADEVLSNPSKNGFLIADAGGGTLDISSYAIKGTAPLAMEEIAPPDCIFAGSVFVSRRAREFFQEKLKDSKYGTPDTLDHIARRFDETTKRLFRDSREMQFVPFGSPLDKDLSVGIRNGQLKLSGNEVANLFEPSVDAAVSAIKAQIQASNGIIKSVFLVGGYAASPWLFAQLQERLAPHKITVSRPDTQTSKAVADGAIGFYCDHHVSARMSKFMYGVEFLRELDPNNPDHERRKEKLCELPSGPKLLPDAFDCILARGIKVKESTVFTRKYCTELTNLSMLSVFEVEVWCYRGGNTVPEWINRHDDNFSTLCVVQADLSLLSGSAEPKQGKNGKKYWTIVFSVEIHFGLTEFKARMKWKDKDQTKFGPAVIVYNERGHRIEDDDIDVYPEDDVSSHKSNSRNNANNRSSRSHTPIDAYFPASSSNSRRASAVVPDVTRMTTDVSKGYTPSVTPSTRGATYRSSDGERTGSDSEKRKGKERQIDDERDRHRGMPGGPSPIEKTTSNGLGPSKIGSTHSAIEGGEMLSPNPPPATFSRSPSIKPQSRTQSNYGGDGDHNSADDVQPPKSAVDEHRQSYLWDNPAPPISPRSAALDAILDRPRSAYGQVGDHQSRSQTPYGGSRPRTPFAHEPLVPGHSGSTSGISRSNTPFIDRPKSGIEGSFFDRPKSAFGGGSVYGDSGPAMFGDSGPAANIGSGVGTPLFGDPPASVFGDAHMGESGGANDAWDASGVEQADDNWNNGAEVADSWSCVGPEGGVVDPLGGVTEGGVDDDWSIPVVAATASAEEPAIAITPSTAKKGKNKRKNSTAISTPASGLASRASPALSTKKSPFENTGDTGFYDDPAPAPSFLDVGTTSASPAIHGGGLWGSKAPSPKPLSPLNPASQINDDPSATVQDEFNWGFETNGGTGAVAGGETGRSNEFDWNLGGNPTKTPSRAPSPIPPPPEPLSAIEKEPVATGKGKKKKKGSGATTPAKSPTQEAAEEEERARAERAEQERLAAEADRLAAEAAAKEEEERARAEQERLAAEADRLAAEAAAEEEERARAEQERLDAEAEADKLTAEAAARLQAEQEEQERAERERVEQERLATEAEKAAAERLEQERLAQEEKDKVAAAATPVSAFGSEPPVLFSDTGGGDDSWASGWGSANAKKKKSKGATVGAASQPSAFGSTWGASVFGETTPTLAEELPPSQEAAGLFSSFSSTTPNLSFGFGDYNKSEAASPAPTPAVDEATSGPPEIEGNPTDVVSHTADNDAVGEEEGWGTLATSKSKKKKKNKGGANANDVGTGGAETPKEDVPAQTFGVEEEPPMEAPMEADTADNNAVGEEESLGFTATSKKNKKKKNKGGANANDVGTGGAETPKEDVLGETLGAEDEPAAETPIETETPVTETATPAGGGKRKKKGKK